MIDCDVIAPMTPSSPSPPTPPLATAFASTGDAVHARQCARPSTAARHRASDRNAVAALALGDDLDGSLASTADASTAGA